MIESMSKLIMTHSCIAPPAAAAFARSVPALHVDGDTLSSWRNTILLLLVHTISTLGLMSHLGSLAEPCTSITTFPMLRARTRYCATSRALQLRGRHHVVRLARWRLRRAIRPTCAAVHWRRRNGCPGLSTETWSARHQARQPRRNPRQPRRQQQRWPGKAPRRQEGQRPGGDAASSLALKSDVI